MNNIFNWLHRREADSPTPGIPRSTADTSSQGPAGADYASRIVHPTGRASLLIPAWYRGVTLIMQTMGQMEVQFQRMNREGGNFIEDRYGASRLINYLLQIRPNPLMTGSQMLEQIEYQKIFKGNAYVYIDYSPTGSLNALWLCQNGSYNPIGDTYNITYRKPEGFVSKTVPSDNVLHFRNIILNDQMSSGLPTIDFAINSLSIAATADAQTLKDMAKGGKHKILVQERPVQNVQWGALSQGRADKKEMEKLTDRLSEEWMSRDAVLLDNIADVKIISQTAAELRTLENRGFQVADLARLLGIPTIMMMVDSGNNYKTPEAATQEFLLRTIQPRIREMEDEFNSKLLGPDDFGKRRIHICESALRRLDPQQQANLDKIHLETGVMSPNELRAQYDLPTVEDGDVHYVSTNLAVLGSEKLMSNGGGRPAGTASGQTTTEGGEE